jgi:N-acetylmuramoyl-L-alanine amidase
VKFALVVGHEADRPGAHAVAPLDCYEYEYNKAFAALIACALMDDGIQSEIFFRDKVGIVGAYDEVNRFDPLGVIELHFNAAGMGDIRGTETLFSSKIAGSDRLAAAVHASICVGLNRRGSLDRGVKLVQPTDRGFVNLTSAKCPSALIEPFFGDSKEDATFGLEQKKELAAAVARGIAIFMRGQSALN